MTRIFDDAGTSFDDINATYDGAEFSVNRQINFKPNFDKAERITALYDATTTTYNDATVDFSSASQTYGGSDYRQDIAGNTMQEDIKPNNLQIVNL